MPAYNVASFITESIESVINQSFTLWELIIVDDCSTDDTRAIVSNYLSDNRIQLIENDTNLGGAETRNVAIRKAKGRYIAFLDSDDLWAPTKLEKQLAVIKENNIGFSYTGYTNITEGGERLETLSCPSKLSFKNLLKHNYIGCLTVIYDTKPHGKFMMPPVKKRQDFALWLELLKKFKFAYGLNENLAFYRIRQGSLSRSRLDAFKYYWLVLRTVANKGIVASSYYLFCYVTIVLIKKKFPRVYNALLK
jgi:glycosyltransferase involved in cell wall biosynthesis